uniref:Cytochrome b5 n=1 Tax=Anthurium amnicola TaxID=1678845 RepID=A0A1D1Z874_9ARAE
MEELKRIPVSEVALHTSRKDCWLVIHGRVYDVTEFLEDHPGGDEVLIHASGTGDASQSFEDVGHSSTAKSMMSSYLIGVLEGYDASQLLGAGKNLKVSGGQRSLKANNAQETSSFTLMDFLLPLLILGVAVVSWYMLTYKSTT